MPARVSPGCTMYVVPACWAAGWARSPAVAAPPPSRARSPRPPTNNTILPLNIFRPAYAIAQRRVVRRGCPQLGGQRLIERVQGLAQALGPAIIIVQMAAQQTIDQNAPIGRLGIAVQRCLAQVAAALAAPRPDLAVKASGVP